MHRAEQGLLYFSYEDNDGAQEFVLHFFLTSHNYSLIQSSEVVHGDVTQGENINKNCSEIIPFLCY